MLPGGILVVAAPLSYGAGLSVTNCGSRLRRRGAGRREGVEKGRRVRIPVDGRWRYRDTHGLFAAGHHRGSVVDGSHRGIPHPDPALEVSAVMRYATR
jgi:hypothetical protein